MEEQLQNNFGQTQGRSIGVEMEFQLIDLKTMDLTNKVNELIERVGDDPCITPEAFQCSVEIKSNPQRNSEEVKREIQGKIAKLMMHLDPLGIRLCSMGLHPFSKSVARQQNHHGTNILKKAILTSLITKCHFPLIFMLQWIQVMRP